MLTNIQFSLLPGREGDYPSLIPGNEMGPLTCSFLSMRYDRKNLCVVFSYFSCPLKGVLKPHFLNYELPSAADFVE